jgi:ubiquitin-protein ligase
MNDPLQNNKMLSKQYLELKTNYKCYIESLVIINLIDKNRTTDDIDTNRDYLDQLSSQKITAENEEEFQNVYYMLNGLSVIIGCDFEYPFKAPKVKINTKIFHPNVDENGIMKFTLIDSGWSPAITLINLVNLIKELLVTPDIKTYNNKEALSLYNIYRPGYYKKCLDFVIMNNVLN